MHSGLARCFSSLHWFSLLVLTFAAGTIWEQKQCQQITSLRYVVAQELLCLTIDQHLDYSMWIHYSNLRRVSGSSQIMHSIFNVLSESLSSLNALLLPIRRVTVCRKIFFIEEWYCFILYFWQLAVLNCKTFCNKMWCVVIHSAE